MLEGHEPKEEHALAVAFFGFASYSGVFSAYPDGTVHIWDSGQSGQPTETWRAPLKHRANAAAFSHDGLRVAFYLEDGALLIRALDRTYAVLKFILGHEGVSSVDFSHDGSMIVSGFQDGMTRIYEIDATCRVALFEGHTGTVRSAKFSPDDRCIATGSDDETVRIWDATARETSEEARSHTKAVSWVTISPDGSRVASCSNDDKHIHIWDANNGSLLKSYKQHESEHISSVVFSRDSLEVVCGDYDGRVRIWDITGNGDMYTMDSTHGSSIDLVALSPDGTRILSLAQRDTMKTWHYERKTHLVSIEISKQLRHVVFSPDNSRLASMDADGIVQVYDIDTLRTVTSFEAFDKRLEVLSLEFSLDGKYIRCGTFEEICVWNAETGGRFAIEMAPVAYVTQMDTPVISCDSEGWLWLTRLSSSFPLRLCWIPPSRRPRSNSKTRALAWASTKVAMGSRNGMVSFLDVSSHPSFRKYSARR
jgi:WD40 repeat protein